MQYEHLRPYCETATQHALLDALNQCATKEEAAKHLGVGVRNVFRCLRRIKKHAAAQGVSPEHDMVKSVPEGYRVKGVSTLYDENGEVKVQWVKSNADKGALQEAIDDMRESFIEGLPRESAVLESKTKKNTDLLNLHILTDYHLGMYAWKEEAGQDWDAKIAEDLLIRWFQYAIRQAPKASVGILAQLGDFIHIDSFDAVTPTNKHLLDTDGRYQKLVRIAIRSLRRIIRMMLKKYDKVHIIMADANHDPASSAWLREVFHTFYEDEPRVTVDRSASTYYQYIHGHTSLFFHHGHRRNPKNVAEVFAKKFRDAYGATKQSYAHLGHLHHKDAKEYNLMMVEQHRTMAANDAYSAQGGWLSDRGAPIITYHNRYGDVGRFEVDPRMLEQSC